MASHRLLTRLRRTALQSVPLVLGVIVLNFAMIQMLPGDAAEVYAGEAGFASRETMDLLRQRFGIDQPVLAQLAAYLTNLLRFDLGFSIRYSAPVSEIILSRLEMTLVLKGAALVFALIVGVGLGVVMAVWRGTVIDRVLSILTLALYSTPGFWVGLSLIVLFAVKLGWLPSDGYRTIGADLDGWDHVRDVARHLVLPALASSTFFVAIFARLVRTSMIEIAEQDFVRTARAKGLSPVAVTLRHVLRNALIPLTTMTGMQIGTLIGGSVVIETIFSWPGLGRLAYDSILARDHALLLGILLVSSFVVIAANAVTDLVQASLDPRIRE